MLPLLAFADGVTTTTVSASDLGLANPLVLGPLAAFVFAVFVFEIVVPGKAYKREVAENERLRELTNTIIPVAEEMVAVSKKMVEVMDTNTRGLERILDFMRDQKYAGRAGQ